MIFISLFMGWFGINRFMLGDIKMGIIKLLARVGCFGL